MQFSPASSSTRLLRCCGAVSLGALNFAPGGPAGSEPRVSLEEPQPFAGWSEYTPRAGVWRPLVLADHATLTGDHERRDVVILTLFDWPDRPVAFAALRLLR